MNGQANSNPESTETVAVESASDVTPAIKETESLSAGAKETTEVSAKSEDADGESEETETLEADSDDEGTEAKPKKKGGFQKKIEREQAKALAAAEEAKYWREQALKGAAGKEESKAEAKPVEAQGKPKEEDFETHQEYLEKLTDWKVKQEFEARDKNAQMLAKQAEHESLLKSYSEKAKAFEAVQPDFKVVTDKVADVFMSPILVDAILDNGPEFQYELAKDPKELQRIIALSPIAQAKEIGKIEARLAQRKEKPQEKKLTTKAPAPIKAVGSSSPGGVKSLEDMDQEEFNKARREQLRAR